MYERIVWNMCCCNEPTLTSVKPLEHFCIYCNINGNNKESFLSCVQEVNKTLFAAVDMQDIRSEVRSPSGITCPAELVATGNDTYCVRFVPTEMGVHSVSVRYKGEHVPGSPFQFTVGPLGEGGASKVRAGGPGLKGAQAGEPGTHTSDDRGSITFIAWMPE